MIKDFVKWNHINDFSQFLSLLLQDSWIPESTGDAYTISYKNDDEE